MFSDKNKSMIHPFLADPSGAKETEDTGRIFTKLLTLYFRVVELYIGGGFIFFFLVFFF